MSKQLILTLPGRQPAILDSELARQFEVETKHINQSRTRNFDRFPDDFAFQLARHEVEFLRSQTETFSQNKMLTTVESWFRYHPWAYTEEGVAMMSGILTSPLAVAASVRTLRLFRELRQDVLPALAAENAALRTEILTVNPVYGTLARCHVAGLTNAEAGKVVSKSADAVSKIYRKMAHLGLVTRDPKALAHCTRMREARQGRIELEGGAA